MKCKCIKSSTWFKIDDSLEQNLNGGKFEFLVGKEYNFKIENTNFGDCYYVSFDENKEIGFGTSNISAYNFFDYFVIIDNINSLLENVDWKNIPSEDIEQIKHEAIFWYDDYSKLQTARKLLGEDIGDPFSIKFDNWIVKRIEMVSRRL